MLDQDLDNRSEELTPPHSEGLTPVNARDAPLDQTNICAHFDEAGEED